LTGHGLPKDLIDAAFDIGKGFFSEVPEKERRDPRWAFGNDYVRSNEECGLGLVLTLRTFCWAYLVIRCCVVPVVCRRDTGGFSFRSHNSTLEAHFNFRPI
jgi:hypothetical protein